MQASKRHAYLLNDVLLITSPSGGLVFSEKISIYNIFELDDICIDIRPFSDSSDEDDKNNLSFDIISSTKTYTFITSTKNEKKIWVEEIQDAILAYNCRRKNLKFGWFHDCIRGTIYSAAYLGDEQLLIKYINKASKLQDDLLSNTDNNIDDQTKEGTTNDIIMNLLDSVDQSGMTPLHWACVGGNYNCVKYLLDANCYIESLNNGLNSPLLLASALGFTSIIVLLLEYDANVTTRNLKDYDCLLMVCIYGSYSSDLIGILRHFLIKNVDFGYFNMSGFNVLHECCQRNLSNAISALIEIGIDVNSRSKHTGLTALQMACANESPDVEIVRLLLDRGSNPNLKDNNKKTAFEIIIESNRIKSNNHDTTSTNGLKLTLDDVADFVQIFLPTLIELVRKGCRYSPETINYLRSSFQEVINSARDIWKQLGEPENFNDFVLFSCGLANNKKYWVNDSDSSNCLLCMEEFGFMNRRHHCRSCGVLCCDLCSSKRLRLSLENNKTVKQEKERVCDGCYNRLIFSYQGWNATRLKLLKDTKKEEDNSNTSPSSSVPNSPKNLNSTTSSLNNDVQDMVKNLSENVEKAKILDKKSEALKEGASTFLDHAKQLNKNLKNKKI